MSDVMKEHMHVRVVNF